jgi:hypothetical protein
MDVVKWIVDNYIGDLASIVGIVITIIGFIITVTNVRRSKSAAERAEKAATAARLMMRGYEALSEFATAIAIMDEIKRLHRMKRVDILPDRYAALRKGLITVRRLIPSIERGLDIRIQSALAALTGMENHVEKSIFEETSPNFSRLNLMLSREIDDLQAALVDMTIETGRPT